MRKTNYYANNKEKVKKKSLEYYYLNKDKIIEKRKKYYLDNRSRFIEKAELNPRKHINKKKYYKKHKKEILKKMVEKKLTRRQALLEKLGKVCKVCGESNYRYLHIDRIKGGEHPRNFEWIVNNINQFQILCANHHNEKTVYKTIIWPIQK